jgi:hypothetical protein
MTRQIVKQNRRRRARIFLSISDVDEGIFWDQNHTIKQKHQQQSSNKQTNQINNKSNKQQIKQTIKQSSNQANKQTSKQANTLPRATAMSKTTSVRAKGKTSLN